MHCCSITAINSPTRTVIRPWLLILASAWVGGSAQGAVPEEFEPQSVKQLDAESAKKYLRLKGVLSFGKVTKLDPATAAVLAKHPDGLELNGLTTLDERTAQALATAKGSITLNGLATIDDDAAAALATSRAHLTLEGLRELKSGTLVARMARQGGVLRFPNVLVVDPAMADILGSSNARVELRSLTELTHEGLARRLLNAGPEPVHCEFLHTIRSEGCKGLCGVPCDLYLPAVVTLGDAECDALRGHQGVLDFNNLREITPDGLAALLANTGPLGLGSVQTLGAPAPEKLLQALATHKAPLCLSGLNQLTPQEAAAIKKRTAPTDLDGLKALTLPVVRELINCNSYVWLMGLERLEQGVAAELLKHKPREGTGFIVPNSLRSVLADPDELAFERHDGIHFDHYIHP